jgi:hypothetical protein
MSLLDRLLTATRRRIGRPPAATCSANAAGTGSVALADMTGTTADAIAAFAAPALGIASAPTMPHVLAQHASLHAERLVAATGA